MKGSGLRAVEIQWLLQSIQSVAKDQLSFELKLIEALERLEFGEPLQYVLGSWQFRGLEVHVDRRALIPRAETELIVDIVSDLLRADRLHEHCPRTVVEIGLGTGVISLAIAQENPSIQVFGTEVDAAAFSLAQENLEAISSRNGTVTDRVTFLLGSLFEPIPIGLERGVDVVVSNPPYLSEELYQSAEPKVRDFEPELALTPGGDGLGVLALIARDAVPFLRVGASLILEHSPEQRAPLAKILEMLGYEGVRCIKDLVGRDRFTVAVAPKRRDKEAG
ncbi:MAG: N5-glutamine methyltransferase family protein [Acidimicrobiales bacterium]